MCIYIYIYICVCVYTHINRAANRLIAINPIQNKGLCLHIYVCALCIFIKYIFILVYNLYTNLKFVSLMYTCMCVYLYIHIISTHI